MITLLLICLLAGNISDSRDKVTFFADEIYMQTAEGTNYFTDGIVFLNPQKHKVRIGAYTTDGHKIARQGYPNAYLTRAEDNTIQIISNGEICGSIDQQGKSTTVTLYGITKQIKIKK